jgi:hypothetical protein
VRCPGTHRRVSHHLRGRVAITPSGLGEYFPARPREPGLLSAGCRRGRQDAAQQQDMLAVLSRGQRADRLGSPTPGRQRVEQIPRYRVIPQLHPKTCFFRRSTVSAHMVSRMCPTSFMRSGQ